MREKPNLLYGNTSFNYCPLNNCLLGDYSIEGVDEYDKFAKFMPPIVSFIKNYNDMGNNNLLNGEGKEGTDKYFHSKANFQSGQNARNSLFNLGLFPTIGQTLLLDIGKEVFDIAKKNGFRPNGRTLKENLRDSMEDIYADLYGLGRGLLKPEAKAQDQLEIFRNEWINGNY